MRLEDLINKTITKGKVCPLSTNKMLQKYSISLETPVGTSTDVLSAHYGEQQCHPRIISQGQHTREVGNILKV